MIYRIAVMAIPAIVIGDIFLLALTRDLHFLVSLLGVGVFSGFIGLLAIWVIEHEPHPPRQP